MTTRRISTEATSHLLAGRGISCWRVHYFKIKAVAQPRCNSFSLCLWRVITNTHIYSWERKAANPDVIAERAENRKNAPPPLARAAPKLLLFKLWPTFICDN